MPSFQLHDIEIAYEVEGSGPPLLMIMGIGSPMVWWPRGFLDTLLSRGLQLIRFDNRDVGKSTWLDHHGVPNVRGMLPRAIMGMKVDAPYDLSDMAGDAAALLDHLGLSDAHVYGVSMGGMIAQQFTIDHPARVRSLVSMMSTTGDRLVSVGKPHALKKLMQRTTPGTREEAIERRLDIFRTIHGDGYPLDEDLLRQMAGEAWDHGLSAEGFSRQFGAVLASGSRTKGLKGVKAPTLVIHGARDPLMPLSGGRATAKAIPGARLVVLDRLGHSLPREVWEEVADLVSAHVHESEAS